MNKQNKWRAQLTPYKRLIVSFLTLGIEGGKSEFPD